MESPSKRRFFASRANPSHYKAPKTDPRDKFNIAYAHELYAWIVPAVLKFQGALTARYRKGLNSRGRD
jgi:hypothetical protein